MFFKGKQSDPPTDYYGLHMTAEQHKDITHLFMSTYTEGARVPLHVHLKLDMALTVSGKIQQ